MWLYSVGDVAQTEHSSRAHKGPSSILNTEV